MADRDFYTGVEYLADQAGSDSVLTFKFSKSVNAAFVRCISGDGTLTARAVANGQTPSSSFGMLVPDEPTPVLNITEQIKVYAPTGALILCWGYTY